MSFLCPYTNPHSSDNSALIASAIELYATQKLLSPQGYLTMATQNMFRKLYLTCTGKGPVDKVK